MGTFRENVKSKNLLSQQASVQCYERRMRKSSPNSAHEPASITENIARRTGNIRRRNIPAFGLAASRYTD